MLAGYPAEAVPDGNLLAPHHYLLGVYALVVVALLVLNDSRTTDPLGVLAGACVALFAWHHLWGLYPIVGATAALGGLVVVLAALVIPVEVAGVPIGGFWNRYGRELGLVVLVATLVALDDWVSHALGWPTPLDWVWHVAIYPYMA
jgi:hypothetical protein